MKRRGAHNAGGRIRGVASDAFLAGTLARLSDLAFPAGIVVLTVLSFLPSLDNGFVEWDDDLTLQSNGGYRGLGWLHLKWMFADFHFGHYSPLAWLTYAADYIVWGLDPLGYHLTSLLLHAASAVVVYLIALRLLRAAIPAAAAHLRRLQFSASLAALVFSVHPLRVEAVAWATARLDILCGVFYLLAVLIYLRRQQEADAGPAVRRRRYWVCLALFVLALLSKSMAVTLPAALLLLDVYPLRRFGLTPAGLSSAQARQAVIEKLPLFALSVLAAAVAFRATLAEDILTTETALGPIDRVGIGLYGLGLYISKLVWPIGFANLYPLKIPFDPFTAPILLSAAGVAALILVFAWLWRSTPALLIAFAAYAIVLIPVSGLFHKGPQIAADRYAYLPTLPWAMLLGAIVLKGWGLPILARRPGLRIALLGVAPCFLVVALCVLTWQQVQVWHDSASLWANTVRHAPSARAHHGLGRELDAGRSSKRFPTCERVSTSSLKADGDTSTSGDTISWGMRSSAWGSFPRRPKSTRGR